MSILSFLGIKTVKQSNDAIFAAQQKAIVDKIAAINSQATNAAINAAVPGYVATPSADYKTTSNITSTMGTTFTNIWTWIKGNILLASGIGLVIILLFFPKVLKGLFGGSSTHRVRHRRPVTIARVLHRRRVHHAIIGSHTRRRTMHRRTKGAKKPWQVKGSLAARRHMAQIRARR
jgi:hypothetical protein